VESVGELDNRWVVVIVSCYCEKLVDEAGDSSGTQRKENRLRRPGVSISYSGLRNV
jgi:hypothetical protein